MKQKKIDLLSPPFKGHLHPILAMGRILAKDYEVTILSSAAAKTDIEAAGLQAKLLTSIDDRALFACVNPAYPVRSSPQKLLHQFRQVLTFFQHLKRELELIYATRNTHLLIADFTLPIAGFIAKQRGIPWWTSMPSPCVIECQGGTPSYLGGWQESDNLSAKIRDCLGRASIRTFKKIAAFLCKKHIHALGLRNIYRKDGTEAIYSEERILCLGYQELEFSRPWPKAVRFVGPMLFSPKCEHTAPLFQPEKKHVLVTLGTHLDWCKEDTYREIKASAKGLPDTTFHFSHGNTHSAKRFSNTEQFASFPYINYEEHLPKYDWVIHHGGAGIMYHCIQHGKPSIVIPQDYDQFDHAARLTTRGLGIRVNKPSQITKALNSLIANKSIEKQITGFRNNCLQSNENFSLSKLVEQKLRQP